MKIYEYRHPNWGIVFSKISRYIRQYAPSDVVWVDSIDESDLQIIHIVGLGEVEIAQKSPNKIIWQHCYKTAGDYPWDNLWMDSLMAVSFHNFRNYSDKAFNFLHLPLGYDETMFYPETPFDKRSNAVFVTGHLAKDETIDIILDACKKAGYLMLHTGENFKFDSVYYQYIEYLPEDAYATMLRNVPKYVFGLRQIEGFEVAALEGIASGAMGVVPTLPTYDWYNGIAIRIDLESSNLSENIYNILKNSYKINVNKEILEQYTWSNIMTKFWNEVCQLLKK